MKKLALLSLLFCLSLVGFSKSYTIEKVKIETHVLENGHIEIVEYRTYNFKGSFKWASYEMPRRGFVEMLDIRLSEDGTDYLLSGSEDPYTFQVDDDKDDIEVKWFYRANNERKTFRISYTLTGAIVVGPDWCEFFWTFISDEWEEDTQSTEIEVLFPWNISPDSLKVFTRPITYSDKVQYFDNGFSLNTGEIDDDDVLKVRTIFPVNGFNILMNDPDHTLEHAERDEAAYIAKAEKRLERKKAFAEDAPMTILGISALSIFLFCYFYFQYGRKHEVLGVISRNIFQFPSEHSPAIVRNLIISSLPSADGPNIAASLFELGRKGYIELEGAEGTRWKKNRFWVNRPENRSSQALTSYERVLYETIEASWDKGAKYLDEIFSHKYAPSNWHGKYQKTFGQAFKKEGFVENESKRMATIHGSLQFVLCILSVVIALYFDNKGLLIPFIITIVMGLGSFAIIRLNRHAQELKSHWLALRNAMKDGSLTDLRSLDQAKVLTYAVAFGFRKKQLTEFFEESSLDPIHFAWLNADLSDGALAAVIASTAGSAASAASAAGGAAAGAAGGGAGGGAG